MFCHSKNDSGCVGARCRDRMFVMTKGVQDDRREQGMAGNDAEKRGVDGQEKVRLRFPPSGHALLHSE